MDFETAYTIANMSVMPVWLAMMFAPRAALTRRLVQSPAVPLVYAAAYAALFVTSFFTESGGGFATMAELRAAFDSDVVLLMAWVHYLCFDMVVGMWEVRDAERHELSAWVLAPCLFFTLMAGPIGFGLYYGVRRAKTGAAGF